MMVVQNKHPIQLCQVFSTWGPYESLVYTCLAWKSTHLFNLIGRVRDKVVDYHKITPANLVTIGQVVMSLSQVVDLLGLMWRVGKRGGGKMATMVEEYTTPLWM